MKTKPARNSLDFLYFYKTIMFPKYFLLTVFLFWYKNLHTNAQILNVYSLSFDNVYTHVIQNLSRIWNLSPPHKGHTYSFPNQFLPSSPETTTVLMLFPPLISFAYSRTPYTRNHGVNSCVMHLLLRIMFLTFFSKYFKA